MTAQYCTVRNLSPLWCVAGIAKGDTSRITQGFWLAGNFGTKFDWHNLVPHGVHLNGFKRYSHFLPALDEGSRQAVAAGGIIRQAFCGRELYRMLLEVLRSHQ